MRTRPGSVGSLGFVGFRIEQVIQLGGGAHLDLEQPAVVVGRVVDGLGGVVECLVDLLRDPVENMRHTAVRALTMMAASEASGSLAAYRGRLSAQDQADIDRSLATIRKGDKPRHASLEKQIESLEDRLRKLEDVIRKLEAERDTPADA